MVIGMEILSILIVGAMSVLFVFAIRQFFFGFSWHIKDGFDVEYTLGMRIVALVILGTMIFLLSVILFYGWEEGGDVAILLSLLLLVSLSVPLVLEFFFVKLEFDENIIVCHSPWRKKREIHWSQIVEAFYYSPTSMYKVLTKSIGIIRIPVTMSNQDCFFEIYEKKTNKSRPMVPQ